MSKILTLLICLATSATAIDKNVFKNCSRVPFCTKLRSNHVDENSRYHADISLMTTRDYTVIFPLKNGLNSTLSLELTLLDKASARIQIKQPGSKRFELKPYAFANKLVAVPYHITNLANLSIAFRHHEIKDFSVIVVKGPPFRIEVYRGGNLELLINTERFVMEHNQESQAFAFTVEFEAAEKLYGLFDHAYQIALPETANGSMDPFRLKNVDAYEYEVNSPMALYGSVPVIYGHSAQQTSGMFLYNAAEQWVDISYNSPRPSAYFMVESAALDIFLFSGPTPKEVVRQFTELTGTYPLPPLWSLGYHQSRMTYASQEEVKDVVAKMVSNNFPMDSIWLDGGYTDSFKWYRWHPTAFSDPVEMQHNISAHNKTCVLMGDPLVKIDNNYSIYSGAKGEYFVLTSNKSDYKVSSSNLSFSIADNFWSMGEFYFMSVLEYNRFNGSTQTLAGVWNDLNEPTTFDKAHENTLPSNALHRLDENTQVLDRDVHNIFGLLQSRTTYYGLRRRDQQRRRPFVLTRSHYAGSQQFAAVWTGDNSATWEHFEVSISQCLTGNILGMVFCGADIGGFIGDPSDELLQRWYQGAVWLPFFRGHSSNKSKRREPYLFSKDVQNVIRSAIELRYKHIPYLYTLLYEHSVTGDPVIRPLFYHYPGIHGHDTQILVGENIMAVAVVKQSAKSTKVFFPGTESDIWYKIENSGTWSSYSGGTTADVPVDISSSPVFYRGGSIIVRRDEVKLSTTDMWESPYTVYVNLNKDNLASGRYYMDDYISFDYSRKQEYFYYNLRSDKGNLNLTKINGNSHNFNPKLTKVIVHSVSKRLSDGSYEVKEKVYSSTSDGQFLDSYTFGELSDIVLTF